MSLKMEFVEKASKPDANIAALCREFSISRETGHKWLRRFRERGYDQAELIAAVAADDLGLSWQPALVRSRATVAQYRLDRRHRARNVHDAFQLRAGTAPAVAGRWVVLVDDIVTTGATLVACADALLDAAGLPVHDSSPSDTTPVVPAMLVCTPAGNGKNMLTWDRNGNLPRTTFDIEAKRGAATGFSHVYSVTATKYKDASPAGAPVIYRVRARRGARISDPSNEAGLS